MSQRPRERDRPAALAPAARMMRAADKLEVFHALEDARGALLAPTPRPLDALEKIEQALAVMDAVTI